MTDYYIAHSGAHKYISKEWKNGHWVYKYYKPKAKQGVKDAINKVDAKKVLDFINPFSSSLSIGKKAVDTINEGAKSKSIKEKEKELEELERQLEIANRSRDGVYTEASFKGGSGAAGELIVKSKSEIEAEILKLRNEINEKNKTYAKHSYDEGTGWIVIPAGSDLTHHGIDGMKWGHRNGPPYPLSKAQHNKVINAVHKVAKIAESANERRDRKADKKLEKKMAKDAQKRLKANVAAEKRHQTVEERREHAVRKGSYKELYALKDELSFQELSNAMSKIDLDQRLYSKAYPKKPGFFDRMDNISNGIGKINNWTKKGIDLWDTYADIMNSSESVRSGKREPIRKIRSGGDNKKKNKDKNNDD